jgi:hypothetical protein
MSTEGAAEWRQERDAHKQAQENLRIHDPEFVGKVQELTTNISNLRDKLPTLLDDKGQPTPEYDAAMQEMQKNIAASRELYHPEKNPGAIAKYGHLLTDALKITSPDQRAQAAQAKQATAAAGDQQEAQRLAAAAPPTAAQLNAQKIQAQLKEIDASNLDDEGKKAARAKVFGVAANAKPSWQQYKLPDGTIRSYDLNRSDNDIPEGATEVAKGSQTTAKESIAGYEDAVKKGYTGSYPQWIAEQRRAGAPSTSALNEYAASYQKAYGIKPEDMTPADWDFIQRKQAFDKAIPQTTTTHTLKQNAEQQWVPVQETNSKSPGGGAPIPPRGKPVNNTPPPSSDPPSTTPAPSPSSPRVLKKEAEDRKPEASGKSSGSGGANSSVRVGDPIMAAPNKEYQDAKTAYDGAIHRKNLMHKNLADALKGNQQAMLSLVANHIGMTLGAQKGARINQAVWNEAVESAPWLAKTVAKFGPDGYLSGVTLAPEQMKQMVDLADESTEVTKQDLDRIHDRINEGVANPSKSATGGGGKVSGGDKPPKATKPAPNGATHYKKHGDKWYYTDDSGKNLGEVI